MQSYEILFFIIHFIVCCLTFKYIYPDIKIYFKKTPLKCVNNGIRQWKICCSNFINGKCEGNYFFTQHTTTLSCHVIREIFHMSKCQRYPRFPKMSQTKKIICLTHKLPSCIEKYYWVLFCSCAYIRTEE